MKYLLRTYATDVSIADTEDEVTALVKAHNETSSQYPEQWVAKTLLYE